MRSVDALVLAAGLGRRFAGAGGGVKLGAVLEGKALVRHVVEAALASKVGHVRVVTGHAAEVVHAALVGLPVTFVHNAGFASGLAGSLRCGLAAVPATTNGVVVLLGDMPRVSVAAIDGLIAQFAAPAEPPPAVVPVVDGQWGNPILIGRTLFPALAALQGDRGARAVLETVDVALWPTSDLNVLLDVDTPAALDALSHR